MDVQTESVRINNGPRFDTLLAGAIRAITSHPNTSLWSGRQQMAFAADIARECAKALEGREQEAEAFVEELRKLSGQR